MSIQGDPRLIVAHWADEATRAAADPDAQGARDHESEDRLAAIARSESHQAARPGLLQRIVTRFRLTRR
jgi:hypothetical protein